MTETPIQFHPIAGPLVRHSRPAFDERRIEMAVRQPGRLDEALDHLRRASDIVHDEMAQAAPYTDRRNRLSAIGWELSRMCGDAGQYVCNDTLNLRALIAREG